MVLLAIGDVVSEAGLRALETALPAYQKLKGVDFTVANGENAAGIGALPAHIGRIRAAGVDVVTLGNHSFKQRDLLQYIEGDPFLLRPANLSHKNPGRGYGLFDTRNGRRVLVISLLGRGKMDGYFDDPFTRADRILGDIPRDRYDAAVVDFHAEMTSEKGAFGYYADGRVSAVFGTHTHIQTCDERILPNGTGFITDLGMTGVTESVIGMDPNQAIARFLDEPGGRYKPADGPAVLRGALFELDDRTGTCRAVERVSIE